MAEGLKTGGRQRGTPNKATAEVRGLAMEHGPAAMTELARLSTEAQSETARISACNTILERAYGKAVPGRLVTIDLPDTSTVKGVTQAVAAIVSAAASGQITPGEAGDLCSILEAQRRVIELSDIQARLAKLEQGAGA
jgi:hypothetical protein